MFHREKTEARQKAAALAGVLAIVGAALITHFDLLPSPEEKKPPPALHSLLSGQIEPYDAARQTCAISPERGLTMSVRESGGTPAACCVVQAQPIDVKAGDDFSARVVPEKAENDFRIDLAAVDGRTIPMTRGALHGSETEKTFRLVLDRNEHLAGKESARIVKFCISAGAGGQQSIRIPAVAISRR